MWAERDTFFGVVDGSVDAMLSRAEAGGGLADAIFMEEALRDGEPLTFGP